MNSEHPHILTVNTGSSSIKFAIFHCNEEPKLLLKGEIQNIGSADGLISIKSDSGKKIYFEENTFISHKEAFLKLNEWLQKESANISIDIIGHRIVHGGEFYSQPVLISSTVIDNLEKLITYDPLHMESEVMGIDLSKQLFPEATHVACFDTAFHHTLPEAAQTIPLPHHMTESGIRRYGFHGLSYEYIHQTLEHDISVDEAKGKLIIAHLGSGASLCALKENVSIDTSMAFTSNSGLIMSTRTGDLDPGLITYLEDKYDYESEQLRYLLSKESGLKGISGISGDMKKLLEQENDDPRAKLAIDCFCYTVKKFIGAYAAVLGGIDTLVFTGGIGEHSAAIRQRICQGLEFLGIDLEETKNRTHELLVSSDMSRVRVRVIPTNEELMIARHANRLYRT